MRYTRNVDDVEADDLIGFFHGWPVSPAPERHLELLRRSCRVVLAVDDVAGVVGFVTAITDGVLCAYIPLLEVRPDHRSKGIGTRLVKEILTDLDGLYMVDLACDEGLQPFYQRLGLTPGVAMVRRDREALLRTS